MKSLAIELFKDENSKPYSFKSKAMDRVCFEGGDKIPDLSIEYVLPLSERVLEILST